MSAMVPLRELGKTGVTVSVVGLGSGQLGEASVSDAQSRRLVAHALDLGINLIDTADSYGAAAERLAPMLRAKRSAIVLSAKVGRRVDPALDGSTTSIVESTDALLRRLGTETIDLLRLRTMPLSVIERDDASRALEDLKAQGKCRFVAFSGENELAAAIAAGGFDVILTSVNICSFRVRCSNRRRTSCERRPGVRARARSSFAYRAKQYRRR